LFPEEEDPSDSDTLKNELLKTIYFPKGVMNIGYLTDKLPKPTYSKNFETSLTDRNSTERKSTKSTIFPNINRSPIHLSDKKSLRRQKNSVLERKSKPSERKHEVSPALSSIERDKPIIQSNPDKLSSLERIANRIEEENMKQNKVEMNIDRQFKELQEILEKQSNFHE
jgi:hypothetical protein